MFTFDPDAAKKWVELFAGPAALATLIFLGVQSCEMSEQNDALKQSIEQASYQDVFEKSLEFDKATLEDPQLFDAVVAVKGEPGAKYLSGKNGTAKRSAEAYAMAVYVIDFYDYILADYPYADYPRLADSENQSNNQDWNSWSNATRGIFREGSHVCHVLIENHKSYNTEFISRLYDAGLCPGLAAPERADA